MGRLNFILLFCFCFSCLFGQLTQDESYILQQIQSDLSMINNNSQYSYEELLNIRSYSENLTYILGEVQRIVQQLEYDKGGTKEDWQTLLQQTANEENWQTLVNTLYTLDSRLSTLELNSHSNTYDLSSINSTVQSLYEISSLIEQIVDNSGSDYSQDFSNLNGMIQNLIDIVDSLRSIRYEVFGTVNIGGFDAFQQQLFKEGIPVQTDVDLSPIITNQLTQIEIEMASTNFLADISLSNQMATNILGKIYDEIKEPEIENPRQLIENVVDSSDYTITGVQQTYDDSQQYLTNLTNSVELKDWEYDFSDYTNVNRVIYKLQNDSFYADALNTTNTFYSAGTKLETTLKEQLESIKPFFSRQYDSFIVINWDLLQVHNIIDLADYVKFDSNILINLYDFILWVLTFISCFYIIRSVWEF